MIERRYEFFRVNQLKCIYVIHNVELNRVKIGITDNIKSRMATLTGSSGCKLVLKFTTPYIRKAKILEKLAHSKFQEHRVIGEWFDITPKDAIRFLESKVSKFIQDDEREFNDFIIEEKRRQSDKTKCTKRLNWRQLDLIRADLYLKNKEISDDYSTPSVIHADIEEESVINTSDRYDQVNNAFKRRVKRNKPVYIIGEEMLLDRPLTQFKRLDKNIFKDKNGFVYEIHYINKQWIMKRIK